MLLSSNSTIRNQTAFGQQNSTCISVDSTAERISKLCAYCVILLGSLFGNMFIIIIVHKNRDLRKTINYFIVNMAVSDLLFSLIIIPREITVLVNKSLHWHVAGMLGSIFCKFSYFASSVSVFVSVQSLVWIAIDRFLAVVFPIKLGIISGKIRTKAIVSTWILAGVFYFPFLITSGVVEHGNETFCSLSKQSIFPKETVDGYFWLHLTIRFLAPLVLLTVLYSAIAITLKGKRKDLEDTSPNVPGQRYLKKRRQATQMAVVILVMFYICVIPYTVVHFLFPLGRFCAFRRLFQYLANLMFLSSSIVNPVICLSFVETYRRGLKNILCPCGRSQNTNLVARREQVTLKRVKNFREVLQQRTSKDSNIFPQTLDTDVHI